MSKYYFVANINNNVKNGILEDLEIKENMKNIIENENGRSLESHVTDGSNITNISIVESYVLNIITMIVEWDHENEYIKKAIAELQELDCNIVSYNY